MGKTILRNSMASSHVITTDSKLLNKHILLFLFVFITNESQSAIFLFVFLENLKLKINAWTVPLTLNWDTGEKHYAD